MSESGTESRGTTATAVEERLRAALAARAHRVGPADLRPLPAPPGPARARRTLVRRTVTGLLVLAAVAALVFFAARGGQPRPVQPARTPHPSTGTPSPAPSPPVPSPVTPEPSPSTHRS
ncbi:hypothetical protein AB0N19_40045 [Streptomyces sp. NPDC051132]|uniref:hypothetical protein n=1 Tax=Streptomyces sp. NPDC051132 TaxID=3155667 RepID=UPI00342AC7B7